MKPLVVVALGLILSINALPESIQDVEELPQAKDIPLEAEASEQLRLERCTDCSINFDSNGEPLASLKALPGAIIHTPETIEECTTANGCFGLKIKDGKIVQRFGDLNAFKAASAADSANEFVFQAADLAGAGNVPFWWMNKDSPFKANGGGGFEKYSSFSSSSVGGAGLGGAGFGTAGLGGAGFGAAGLGASGAGYGNAGLGGASLGVNRLNGAGLGATSAGAAGIGTTGFGSAGLGGASLGASRLGGAGTSAGFGSAGFGATRLGASSVGVAGIGNSGFGNAGLGVSNLGATRLGGAGLGTASIGAAGIGNSGFGNAGLGTASLGATRLGGAGLGTTSVGAAGIGNSGFGNTGLGTASLGATRLGGAGLGTASVGAAGIGNSGFGNVGLGAASLGTTRLGGTGLGTTSVGAAGIGNSGFGNAGLGTASLGTTRLGGTGIGVTGISGAGLGGSRISGAGLGGTRLGGAGLGTGSVAGAGLGYGASSAFAGNAGYGAGFGASSGSSLNLGNNPFLNGDISKYASATNLGVNKPTNFQTSAFSSNNGVSVAKPPFVSGVASFGQATGGYNAFGGSASTNVANTSGNKFSGLAGSAPAGANVNLIQTQQKEFDFGQQAQQNFGSFQSGGVVGGGELQLACTSEGFTCVAKSQCINGVVNGATLLPAKKQFCNVGSEICCRIAITQVPGAFVSQDTFSAGSQVSGVYKPVVSSTVIPRPTFVSTPRPFTAAGPTYLPPVSSTSAPGYLPPVQGEQTINRETIVPKPNYIDGSLILDETRLPRPKNPVPVEPTLSEIPAGCAAALKCTPIEFCTADGVISNTSVVLSREQNIYRVPLTDCKDLSTGRIGKCCRDPYYTDPWPVNQIGKWVPGVFGGNDGRYVPDNRVSQSGTPIVTAKPFTSGGIIIDNFRTTTQAPVIQFGVGQYSKGGQGQYTKGGQGQFAIGGQGQIVTQGGGQFVTQGQGEIIKQGQGLLITPGGEGQIVTQGEGQGIIQGGGAIVSQGEGFGVQQGFGQGVVQGGGAIVSQGEGFGVQQGFGQGVVQGQGTLVSQGEGFGINQGQGTLVTQGGGLGVSQGFGQEVTQGGGALITQGGGVGISQGFGQGVIEGQGSYVQQGEGTAVSQGFGQGISQGGGAYVTQGGGAYLTQGFGTGIRQSQGYTISENEFSESRIHRVFLKPYYAGEQCGLLNNQRPFGNHNELEADFAEIPWQAMVLEKTNKSLLCGGVITRPDVVLTSAACVDGLEAGNVLIKGGEWKLGVDEEPLPFQIVQVKTILVHPFYKRGTYHYDVAILILSENLRFAKNIYPICLPSAQENYEALYNGVGQCIVTGWGKEVLQAHLLGSIMHSLNVSLINPNECQAKMTQAYPHLLEYYDQDSCVCGQPTNPLNNICSVDIGSALACTTGDGHYVLRGVYSWDSGCRQLGNQIGSFYKFDVEWYEWALGLIESIRFAQFTQGARFAGAKGTINIGNGGLAIKQQGAFEGAKGTIKLELGQGGAGLLTGQGLLANQGKFTQISQGGGFESLIKPINTVTYTEKIIKTEPKVYTYTTKPEIISYTTKPEIISYTTKPEIISYTTKPEIITYTTKPKIISYTTKPEVITYTTKPKIISYTTKPEIITYTTKPEIVTFTTKPEYFTYTTKPKIVTYTTKPEIVTYTTKPKIVTYTTKPQFITYETSGSGTDPQYVAPGISFKPSFTDVLKPHVHSASCQCEGKK